MKTLIPLLLLSSCAMADSLQVPIASNHFTDYRDYNEFNPGLIYSREVTENFSFIGGAYLNSLDKLSVVLGGEIQYGHFGAQLGFATGYEDLYGYKLQPTGTLFGEIELTKSTDLRLSIIPHKHGAVVFSVVFDL